MLLCATQNALIAASFTVRLPQLVNVSENAVTKAAKQQLEAYFTARLSVFELPLAPNGTAFQQQVWQALRQIPYGTTTSYKKLAQTLGNEKLIRAVGTANGSNPIAIIIPCHRVIGSGGQLVGYAGGIDRKLKLLQLEQVPAFTQPSLF
jgi:methylated-DNA-[protein]-cysteine S-methyltransferase